LPYGWASRCPVFCPCLSGACAVRSWAHSEPKRTAECELTERCGLGAAAGAPRRAGAARAARRCRTCAGRTWAAWRRSRRPSWRRWSCRCATRTSSRPACAGARACCCTGRQARPGLPRLGARRACTAQHAACGGYRSLAPVSRLRAARLSGRPGPRLPRHGQDAAGQGGRDGVRAQLPQRQGPRAHQHVHRRVRAPGARPRRAAKACTPIAKVLRRARMPAAAPHSPLSGSVSGLPAAAGPACPGQDPPQASGPVQAGPDSRSTLPRRLPRCAPWPARGCARASRAAPRGPGARGVRARAPRAAVRALLRRAGQPGAGARRRRGQRRRHGSRRQPAAGADRRPADRAGRVHHRRDQPVGGAALQAASFLHAPHHRVPCA